MAVRKLVSGGQTGADRAALDVAIELGIDHGGWVIKGKKDEYNNIINDKYFNLREADSDDPNQRTDTEWNVWDSDATLVVSHGPLEEKSPGSAWAMNRAVRFRKPVLHVDFKKCTVDQAARNVQRWLQSNFVEVLNVAGPRETEDNQIYQCTHELLTEVLAKQSSLLFKDLFEIYFRHIQHEAYWINSRFTWCMLASSALLVFFANFKAHKLAGFVIVFGVVMTSLTLWLQLMTFKAEQEVIDRCKAVITEWKQRVPQLKSLLYDTPAGGNNEGRHRGAHRIMTAFLSCLIVFWLLLGIFTWFGALAL